MQVIAAAGQAVATCSGFNHVNVNQTLAYLAQIGIVGEIIGHRQC